MEKINFFSGLQLLFILLISTSCHLDYKKADIKEQLSDTVPETILLNIVRTKVKDGRISSVLEADRVETFKNKNIMEILNLHYMEYNEDGESLTEGWADNSTYYTDTENAEISGKIYFYSETENTGIYAESLSWDYENKILTSPPAEIVTVVRDDGSYIRGSGFITNLQLKEITFSGRVNGVYVDDKDDEDKE